MLYVLHTWENITTFRYRDPGDKSQIQSKEELTRTHDDQITKTENKNIESLKREVHLTVP